MLMKKGNADRLRGVCIAFMLYCCKAVAVLPPSASMLLAVVANYFTSTVWLVPSEYFTMLIPLTGAESCVPSAA